MKILLLLIILFAITCDIEAAAPSISSTSLQGNVTDAMVLSVFGTNFGTSTQMPYLYTRFENNNATTTESLGFLSAFDENDGYGISNVNQMSGSVYCASSTFYGPDVYAADFGINYISTYTNFYYSQWKYYGNFNWGASDNNKFHRDWPLVGISGSTNDFVCGESVSQTNFDCVNEQDPGSPDEANGYAANAAWPSNAWFHHEFVVKWHGDTGWSSHNGAARTCDGQGGNALGPCDGGFYWLTDGQLTRAAQDNYNGPYNLKRVDVGEAVNAANRPPDGSFALVDNILLSTHTSRILLSTCSTRDAVTVWEPQPWKRWDNNGNRIDITLNIKLFNNVTNGTLNNNANLYLYVVTDSSAGVGGVNTNGFALTNAVPAPIIGTPYLGTFRR